MVEQRVEKPNNTPRLISPDVPSDVLGGAIAPPICRTLSCKVYLGLDERKSWAMAHVHGVDKDKDTYPSKIDLRQPTMTQVLGIWLESVHRIADGDGDGWG